MRPMAQRASVGLLAGEWLCGMVLGSDVSELGYDAISISAGPQDFTIGDGFLFTRGAPMAGPGAHRG